MAKKTLKNGIPVPLFIQKRFNSALKNDNIESIFDELDYCVNPFLKYSIWDMDKMATTISRSSGGTIDMFFPRICKPEPQSPDNKSDHRSLVDPNDSEFEMVYSRKDKSGCSNSSSSKPLRKWYLSPKKNCDSDNSDKLPSKSPSIDSDNNEMPLFHSTTIDKSIEKVRLIGETPGSDESDSNSSNAGSLDKNHGQGEHNIAVDSSQLSTYPLAEKNNEEKGHRKSKDGKSPNKFQVQKTTHEMSSDDETSDSSSHDNSDKRASKIKLHKKSPVKESPNSAHISSDEEIIQPSQDLKSGLCLSLGSEDNERINSGGKYTSKTSIEVMKNSLLERSRTSDVSRLMTTSSSHDLSLLDQVKNQMIDVQKLSKTEGNNPLYIEDLTEEEEVLLIQSPKDVDPASFVGKTLSLDGVSSVDLMKSGKTAQYDSLVVKEELGTTVNIVLPNKESQVKLGVFPLSGTIILSEAIEEPVLTMPEIQAPKKVPFPEPLEEICSILSVSDRSSNEARDISLNDTRKASLNDTINSQISEGPKKKKKKHKEKLEDISMNDISYEESIENAKSRKKRKHDCLEVSDRSLNEARDISLNDTRNASLSDTRNASLSDTIQSQISEGHKKKKKKKEKLEDTSVNDILHYEENVENVKSRKKRKHECLEDISVNDINDYEIVQKKKIKKEETEDSVPKKKKKKHHKNEEYEGGTDQLNFEPHNDITLDETTALSSEVQFDDLVPKKKKKKKHKTKENGDVTDQLNFEQITAVKTELEERTSFTSELQTDESVPRKKKKKKHKREEEKEESFVQPALPEVIFSEKHRKHKKKSIE